MTGILIVTIAAVTGTAIGGVAHKITEANTRAKAMKALLHENNEKPGEPNEKTE